MVFLHVSFVLIACTILPKNVKICNMFVSNTLVTTPGFPSWTGLLYQSSPNPGPSAKLTDCLLVYFTPYLLIHKITGVFLEVFFL